MTDSRKPLTPDRMRLTKSEVGALIEACNFRLAGEIDDLKHYEIAALNRAQDKLCGAENDAPDDAAWCLAQARLLCPDGYAVMQLSHIVSSELACQTLAQLMHVAKCNCWACNTFRVIASAAEGN